MYLLTLVQCLLFQLENKACIHRSCSLVGIWLPNQPHSNNYYCNKINMNLLTPAVVAPSTHLVGNKNLILSNKLIKVELPP